MCGPAVCDAFPVQLAVELAEQPVKDRAKGGVPERRRGGVHECDVLSLEGLDDDVVLADAAFDLDLSEPGLDP